MFYIPFLLNSIIVEVLFTLPVFKLTNYLKNEKQNKNSKRKYFKEQIKVSKIITSSIFYAQKYGVELDGNIFLPFCFIYLK